MDEKPRRMTARRKFEVYLETKQKGANVGEILRRHGLHLNDLRQIGKCHMSVPDTLLRWILRSSHPLGSPILFGVVLLALSCGIVVGGVEGKRKGDPARDAKASAASNKKGGKPRPPDLDPRIPWMEDIGLAQVGGPELLVSVEEFDHPAPMTSSFWSLATFRDDLAIAYRDRLVLCTRSGEVIWTRTIEGNCVWHWEVVCDDNRICLLPGRICALGGKSPPVRVFNAGGEMTGEWWWAPWTQHEGVQVARLQDGVLIVDVGHRGRRETLRIGPGADVDPDVLVTSRDLDVDFGSRGHQWGKRSREFWKEGRHHIGFMAARDPGSFGKAHGKQQSRSRPWMNRTLRVKELPFFVPERRQAVKDARLVPGRVLHVQSGGGLVVQFVMINPHFLHPHILYDTDPSSEWAQVDRERLLVAWFKKEGDLRSYMVYPRILVGLTFFENGAYVVTDSTITRWEFVGE